MPKRIAAKDEVIWMACHNAEGWLPWLWDHTRQGVINAATFDGLPRQCYSVCRVRLSEVTPNKRKARA